MSTQTSATAALVTALVLGFASTTLAQAPFKAKPPAPGLQPPTTTTTPTYDMTFGYQALHVPDQWFPFGLNVDGARNFGAFSLVGEVGWALTTDDGEDDDNDEFDADVSQHLWHFAAGARWHGRSAARVWPFAQVLAGAAYLRSSVNDVTDSATKFMLQPGAGVVMVAGDGWGIVGQVDYRRIFLDEDEDGESGQNQFRVFVGIRLILD